MATVTRLIVQVGADTNNLRQGLDRGLGFLRQFAKTTEDIGRRSNIFGNIDVAGARTAVQIAERTAKQMAEQSFRTINQTYINGFNTLRENLARQRITPDQFAQQARDLGRVFNQNLIAKMDTLAAGGFLTERVRAGMVAQFKDLGDEAGKALRERLIQGIQLEQDIGKKLTRGLTLPIVAGFTLIAKSAAEFENNMLRVGSLLEATVPEFRALEDAATKFSTVGAFGIQATEAAKGMQILAQAGFSVTEVMDILPTTLKLAAVEQIDLTTASNIATSVMTAFGIEARGAGVAADVLAKASIDSKATLTDLGVSFTYVGGVAKSVGLEFHETTAALALMAEEGFRGTLAGTALRGAILKLTSPTKEQAAILKKLKIETVDASGKLLSLGSIIKQFEDAEKTFGAFRVGADILKLFGQRAGPGFGALIRQGSLALEEFEANLKNSTGTLDRIARAQVSGLTGAFKQFLSVLQLLAIAIGKSGLVEALTKIIRQITEVIKSFSELSPTVLRVITVIALLAAALGPIVTLVASVKLAFFALGVAGITLGSVLGPAGFILAGLIALAAVLLTVGHNARKAKEGLDDFTSALGLLNAERLTQQLLFEQKELNEQLARQTELRRIYNQELAKSDKVISPTSQVTTIIPSKEANAAKKKLDEMGITVKRYENRISEIIKVLKSGAVAQNAFKQGAEDAFSVMQRLIAEAEEGLLAGADTTGKKKTIFDLLLEQMDLAAAKMKALKSLGQESVGEGILRGQRFGTAAIAGELNKVGDIYSLIIKLVKEKLALNKVEIGDLEALAKAAANYRKALGLEETMKLKERTKIDIPLFDDKEITERFKELQDLSDRIRDLQRQQTLASEAGKSKQSDVLLKRIQENRKILEAMKAAFAALIGGKPLSPAATKQLFEQINEALGGTGVKLEDINDKQKKWNNAVDIAQRSFRQLTRVFRGLGFLDEEMRAAAEGMQLAVNSAQQLAKALSDAKKSGGKLDLTLAISSGVGLAAGIVGVLGGIMGGDEETKKLIAQNNDQLSKLRGELSKNRLEGLGGIEKAARFLDTIEIQRSLQEASSSIRDTLTGKSRLGIGDKGALKFVEEAARRFGLTLDQLKAIAEQNNIEFIKDGKLVAKGLEQLKEALFLTSEALRTFSNTIDIQRSLLETERKLRGIADSPAQQLKEDLQLLSQAAPELFKFIGSISNVTRETAPILRAALLRLIAAIKAGEISAEAFDQFGSADEFLEFVSGLADGLLELTGATNAATDSMRNVPSVLKLDRLRFQSQFTESVDKAFKARTAPPAVVETPVVVEAPVTVETPALDFSKVVARLDSIIKSSPSDLISGLKAIHSAVVDLSKTTPAIAEASIVGEAPVLDFSAIVSTLESIHRSSPPDLISSLTAIYKALTELKLVEVNPPEVVLPEIKLPEVNAIDFSVLINKLEELYRFSPTDIISSLVAINKAIESIKLVEVNVPEVVLPEIKLPTIEAPDFSILIAKLEELDKFSPPDIISALTAIYKAITELQLIEVNPPEVVLPDIKLPDIEAPDFSILTNKLEELDKLSSPDLISALTAIYKAIANINLIEVNPPEVVLPEIKLPNIEAPDFSVIIAKMEELDKLSPPDLISGLTAIYKAITELQLIEVSSPEVILPEIKLPNIEAPDFSILTNKLEELSKLSPPDLISSLLNIYQAILDTSGSTAIENGNATVPEIQTVDFNGVLSRLDAIHKSTPLDLIAGLKSIETAIINFSRNSDGIVRGVSNENTIVNVYVDSGDLNTKSNAQALGDKVLEGLRRRSVTKFGSSVRIGNI